MGDISPCRGSRTSINSAGALLCVWINATIITCVYPIKHYRGCGKIMGMGRQFLNGGYAVLCHTYTTLYGGIIDMGTA